MEITSTGTVNYINAITTTNIKNVKGFVKKEEISENKNNKETKDINFLVEKYTEDTDALTNYYKGDLSCEDLKKVIKASVEKKIQWDVGSDFIDNNKNVSNEEKVIVDEYKNWKCLAVRFALYANAEEGYEIAKENGFEKSISSRDYIYYNAEFYYKWEEIAQVIDECINEAAEELKIIDFSKKIDLEIEKQLEFNYNWNSEKGIYGKMINPDAIPPRDFVFFYREEYSTQYINKGSIYQSSMLICNRRMIVNGLDVNVSDKSELSDEKREKLYKLVGAREFFEDNYRKDGMKVAGPGFLANFVIRYQQFDGINRIETKNFTFNNIEYYHSNETDKEDTIEGKFEYEFLKRRMQRNGGLMQKLRKTE